MRLIVATENKSKLKEIRKILKGVGLQIISLADLDKKVCIIENGKTFLANAKKKAIPVSKIYPQDLVLGEDSGLEVDCLGGAPGIYSKRYAGKSGNPLKNNRKLLKVLEGVSVKDRGANFHCCLVLARSGKLIKAFNGRLTGRINIVEKGSNGFGYDPVLYLTGHKKTVAQLSSSVKNRISHRAKAFNKLKRYLKSKSI
ncbi:MAG: RdgB/HAM1 family non-canonical purine NTP pyrophosphatase [Candidatus Omnitrophica bacterium]|nr:RdgB/HAM1 family non-canonical purine NTP pyrophosphatase [Candidatus Omnitrophota bacterium]